MYHPLTVPKRARPPPQREFVLGARFIARAAAAGGRAFVHCAGGLSRAPAAVLAYLLLERKLRLRDAWDLVRLLRPHVKLNPGQRLFLALLEVPHTDHALSVAFRAAAPRSVGGFGSRRRGAR